MCETLCGSLLLMEVTNQSSKLEFRTDQEEGGCTSEVGQEGPLEEKQVRENTTASGMFTLEKSKAQHLFSNSGKKTQKSRMNKNQTSANITFSP